MQIIGELIYGLEYRGEEVSTPYTVKKKEVVNEDSAKIVESNKLELPDNLYIIGTMNTADISIGGIDYAIRRRKILFNKNIKRNTFKGRNDRFYCQYLNYSENILENQLLKAALNKSKRFIIDYFKKEGKIGIYADIINFCISHFLILALLIYHQKNITNLSFQDYNSYYKPVIKMAIMILNEISIESSGNTKTSNYVIPYAVSMEKLFEFYVRTYLKQNGILSYKQREIDGIYLSRYNEEMQVLLGESISDTANYISGITIPDIILTDTSTNKTVIFDVKYKNHMNLYNYKNRREDRLQILAYCLLYAATDIGHIFPTNDQDTIFKLDKRRVNSLEECKTVMYHELLLDIDKKDDDIAKYIIKLYE